MTLLALPHTLTLAGGEEEDERKNPGRAHTAVELLNSPELQLLSLYSQPVKLLLCSIVFAAQK